MRCAGKANSAPFPLFARQSDLSRIAHRRQWHLDNAPTFSSANFESSLTAEIDAVSVSLTCDDGDRSAGLISPRRHQTQLARQVKKGEQV